MISQQFLIRCTGDKDLKFRGAVMATVSSERRDRPPFTRWRELTIYQTAGGSIVCHEVRRSTKIGEVDMHRAEAFRSAPPEVMGPQIVAFFGRDALAKQLFDAAVIPDVEEIQ
jgi:hypothetical protein